jgi:hypothetical protein
MERALLAHARSVRPLVVRLAGMYGPASESNPATV